MYFHRKMFVWTLSTFVIQIFLRVSHSVSEFCASHGFKSSGPSSQYLKSLSCLVEMKNERSDIGQCSPLATPAGSLGSRPEPAPVSWSVSSHNSHNTHIIAHHATATHYVTSMPASILINTDCSLHLSLTHEPPTFHFSKTKIMVNCLQCHYQLLRHKSSLSLPWVIRTTRSDTDVQRPDVLTLVTHCEQNQHQNSGWQIVLSLSSTLRFQLLESAMMCTDVVTHQCHHYRNVTRLCILSPAPSQLSASIRSCCYNVMKESGNVTKLPLIPFRTLTASRQMSCSTHHVIILVGHISSPPIPHTRGHQHRAADHTRGLSRGHLPPGAWLRGRHNRGGAVSMYQIPSHQTNHSYHVTMTQRPENAHHHSGQFVTGGHQASVTTRHCGIKFLQPEILRLYETDHSSQIQPQFAQKNYICRNHHPVTIWNLGIEICSEGKNHAPNSVRTSNLVKAASNTISPSTHSVLSSCLNPSSASAQWHKNLYNSFSYKLKGLSAPLCIEVLPFSYLSAPSPGGIVCASLINPSWSLQIGNWKIVPVVFVSLSISHDPVLSIFNETPRCQESPSLYHLRVTYVQANRSQRRPSLTTPSHRHPRKGSTLPNTFSSNRSTKDNSVLQSVLVSICGTPNCCTLFQLLSTFMLSICYFPPASEPPTSTLDWTSRKLQVHFKQLPSSICKDRTTYVFSTEPKILCLVHQVIYVNVQFVFINKKPKFSLIFAHPVRFVNVSLVLCQTPPVPVSSQSVTHRLGQTNYIISPTTACISSSFQYKHYAIMRSLFKTKLCVIIRHSHDQGDILYTSSGVNVHICHVCYLSKTLTFLFSRNRVSKILSMNIIERNQIFLELYRSFQSYGRMLHVMFRFYSVHIVQRIIYPLSTIFKQPKPINIFLTPNKIRIFENNCVYVPRCPLSSSGLSPFHNRSFSSSPNSGPLLTKSLADFCKKSKLQRTCYAYSFRELGIKVRETGSICFKQPCPNVPLAAHPAMQQSSNREQLITSMLAILYLHYPLNWPRYCSKVIRRGKNIYTKSLDHLRGVILARALLYVIMIVPQLLVIINVQLSLALYSPALDSLNPLSALSSQLSALRSQLLYLSLSDLPLNSGSQPCLSALSLSPGFQPWLSALALSPGSQLRSLSSSSQFWLSSQAFSSGPQDPLALSSLSSLTSQFSTLSPQLSTLSPRFSCSFF